MTNTLHSYRPDIDGLRAIAVLSVLFYHAFPTLLPGGFIGVDIFFVISGFLITNIIQKEIFNHAFSIRNFYVRRIKRIFPALILVLLATLFVGWAVLLRHEFQQLAWHEVAGAGFFSNIALWAEAGYFDRKSEAKPLLHLWSLGVEEQFYILWPLLLAFVFKFKANLKVVILICLAVSFIAGVNKLGSDPSSAFYLPYYRFWELMIGGLLVVGNSQANLSNESSSRHVSKAWFLFKSANVRAFVGLTLIVLALIYIDKNKAFPGFWALLPTVGAALLITSGPATFIGKYLLSQRIMVSIGLISYPLYLWHWPIFTYARIVDINGVSDFGMSLLLLLSLILASLTYLLVEKPLRNISRHAYAAKIVLFSLMFSMSCILILGLSIERGLIKPRLSSVGDVLSDAVEDFNYPGDEHAYIQGGNEKTILFFGDSFMFQLWPRVEELTSNIKDEDDKPTIIFNTAGGCAPIEGLGRVGRPSCLTYNEKGHELAMSKNVDTIVIGASWRGLKSRTGVFDSFDTKQRILDLKDKPILNLVLSRFEGNISKWRNAGKDVYIILHPPTHEIAHPENFTGRLERHASLDFKQITIKQHRAATEEINDLLKGIAKRNDASLLDAEYLFCDSTLCNFADENRIPYFKDYTHMRSSFVRDHYVLLDELILEK